MYKDSKDSLKDIYKDECNLHVTVHDPEKFSGGRGSHTVPLTGGKWEELSTERTGSMSRTQQDFTWLLCKLGMMDPRLRNVKSKEEKEVLI